MECLFTESPWCVHAVRRLWSPWEGERVLGEAAADLGDLEGVREAIVDGVPLGRGDDLRDAA